MKISPNCCCNKCEIKRSERIRGINPSFHEVARDGEFVIASNGTFYLVCHYNKRDGYHFIKKDGTFIKSLDLDEISKEIRLCRSRQHARTWLKEMSEGFYR